MCREKNDTQVIHIYLDENEQKPDSRDGLRSWYTKVGEFGNKAFNDIAAAMYDCEDEILNYFVYRSTMRQQNPSKQKSSNSGHCYVESLTRDSSYSD